jgi:hypothetical protein
MLGRVSDLGTGFQDLWAIGRILGLKKFGPRFRKKASAFRKALKSAATVDQAQSSGTARCAREIEGSRRLTAEELVIQDHVNDIREYFKGIIIRRRQDTLGFDGRPVLQLPEKEEVNIIVALNPHERDKYKEIDLEVVRMKKNDTDKATIQLGQVETKPMM